MWPGRAALDVKCVVEKPDIIMRSEDGTQHQLLSLASSLRSKINFGIILGRDELCQLSHFPLPAQLSQSTSVEHPGAAPGHAKTPTDFIEAHLAAVIFHFFLDRESGRFKLLRAPRVALRYMIQ